MLLPEDIHPDNSLYVIGGYIIKLLSSEGEFGFMELYADLRIDREVPMPLFLLSLDWLFLIGVISNGEGEGGGVTLCS
jgi:hypothetical protein